MKLCECGKYTVSILGGKKLLKKEFLKNLKSWAHKMQNKFTFVATLGPEMALIQNLHNLSILKLADSVTHTGWF